MATNPGNLIVISAPSGAGKTSLVQALIKRMDNLSASVSHTTRVCRPNETEGENYYFVSKDDFQQMISRDDFVEYAEVFDNLYGTSRAEIQRMLNKGVDLLLEIDWQGARSIRQSHPEVHSIFILPPSQAALRQRLVGRGGDRPEIIEQRMQTAVGEMSHFEEYEYLLINDDFDQAVDELSLIIRACRLKTDPQRRRYKPNLKLLLASVDTI